MTKRIAIYAGSFDPLTNGHLDVLKGALAVADEIIVAIGVQPGKTPVFSFDERVRLIEATVADAGLGNVRVLPFDGLVVDFARENGVTVLVRGVRTVTDVDYEKQMAIMNRDLYPSLDTVMLAPSPAYAHLSSSLVRELVGLGAPVEKFVPKAVVPELLARFGRKS